MRPEERPPIDCLGAESSSAALGHHLPFQQYVLNALTHLVGCFVLIHSGFSD